MWHRPWRSIPEQELFVVSVGTKASLNHLHCWNFQMCFQYLMSVSVVQFDGFEMKVIAFQELFLLLGPLKRTTPLQPLTKYKRKAKSEMVKNYFRIDHHWKPQTAVGLVFSILCFAIAIMYAWNVYPESQLRRRKLDVKKWFCLSFKFCKCNFSVQKLKITLVTL